MAERAGGTTRLPARARARRRRLAPRGPWKPARLRAAAREGRTPSLSVRADTPRGRRGACPRGSRPRSEHSGHRLARAPPAAHRERSTGRIEADALEKAVEVDAENVEALEEEEEPERDHDRAATDLDRAVVVPQPAEGAHRLREDGGREHERNREPERVRTEKEGAL